MQILLIMKYNHQNVGGSDLPAPYSVFLDEFSFITLDAIQFVPFNCMYKEGFDMFDNLLLETITPIGFYLASYVLFIIVRRVFATASAKFRKVSSERSMHILYAYAIQVLFLFLPTISRRIGQALQECTVFDAGDAGVHRYLAADLSISCDNNEYYDTMYYYALVMLIIYPVGVPCILFVMMWAVRDRMNPRGMGEEAVIDKREDDHLYDVEPITAFARIYRPRFWWYVERSMQCRRYATLVF